MLLKDKSIIVTGATSGIGAAAALEIARQGAKVVLAGRREDKGEALAEKIRGEGGKALFVRTDVTQPADIEALVARTLGVFERLDGAFNNAGIPGAIDTFADVPPEEYRKLMAVNLDSVLLCMQHQIKAMRKTGGGAIVNCASILGLISAPGFTAYSTAKHGLIGLTKAAALDHAAEGIRVNAVLPGPVETEIWSHVDQGESIFANFTSAVPMQRYARAEEIAKPVVFLLSDGSSYVTGTCLAIDGGYLLR